MLLTATYLLYSLLNKIYKTIFGVADRDEDPATPGASNTPDARHGRQYSIPQISEERPAVENEDLGQIICHQYW